MGLFSGWMVITSGMPKGPVLVTEKYLFFKLEERAECKYQSLLKLK